MFELGRIFAWFKKNFTTRDWLLILGLALLFFFTRLVNLDKFPIFTDEGIYIRWAKVAWHDATWRFISLTDGRQPLQTWATIPFLKLFPNNPLLAGRLFSVAFGFFGLTGIFALVFYLFGKRAAFYGALFYILTPYFLFYDRMALVDGTVNTGFIWIFFLILVLAQTTRLEYALLLGLVSGFFLLAKSSVRVFLGMGIFAPLLFFDRKKPKAFVNKALNYYFLLAASAVLAIVLYNIQRLSPFFHFVSEKNYTFILRFSEWVKDPWQIFFPNIRIIFQYVFWESAFILPLLGIAGLVLVSKKNWRLGWYFVLWFVIPFLAIAFFGRVIFPRYLNFFATLFAILAAYFVATYKNRRVVAISLVLFILSISYFDYAILFDMKNIPFPPIDRGQYIEGISAGYGVKEIVDYARERSKEKPVILVAEGNFGVIGDMLDASLLPNDKITIRGYWPLDKEELIENQKEIGKNYVLVVFSHRTDFPTDFPIKLIQQYQKPGKRSAFYLFELTR